MKRGAPLQRKTRLGPGKKALENYQKHGSSLRPESKSPARRQEKQADAEWRAAIRAIWGDGCLLRLPGCTGAATEIMHGLSKRAHPELRHSLANGFPGCHRCHVAAHNVPEVAAAMREWCEESDAALGNRRPQPMDDELQAILIRYLTERTGEGFGC